jgi:hypothetical protein
MDRVIGLSELNVRVSAGTAVLHIRVRGTAFDRYYYYIKWEGVHRQNWREYFPWRFIELRGKVGDWGLTGKTLNSQPSAISKDISENRLASYHSLQRD